MPNKEPDPLSGLMISYALKAFADMHYGFTHKVEKGKIHKFTHKVTKGKIHKELNTTAEERVERAKIPFVVYDTVEFKSREDVYKVADKFAEKYGNKIFPRKSRALEVQAALLKIKQELNIA